MCSKVCSYRGDGFYLFNAGIQYLKWWRKFNNVALNGKPGSRQIRIDDSVFKTAQMQLSEPILKRGFCFRMFESFTIIADYNLKWFWFVRENKSSLIYVNLVFYEKIKVVECHRLLLYFVLWNIWSRTQHFLQFNSNQPAHQRSLIIFFTRHNMDSLFRLWLSRDGRVLHRWRWTKGDHKRS